jgi:hypothetical protein
LRLVSDELVAAGEQGGLVSRLRAVIGAKDEQVAALQASLEAALDALEGERELRRRLELRLAEVERRQHGLGNAFLEGADRRETGAPGPAAVRARAPEGPRAGRPAWSSGKGLRRDPDPDEEKAADPPAECRSCRASLDGAEAAGSRWAQVIDVGFIRKVTEWALPGLACPCCGTVTFAAPPAGAHQGAVSYGPALNAAAVLLACRGNVPQERTAQVIGMLLGIPVSAGWVDKAAARVSAQLQKAGFDEAMLAALAGEDVLAADETPVNVL